MSLQECRKSVGLTQSALADMVGVKRLSIACYEAGSRTPSPQVAQKIAAVLRLTTDQMWEMFYGNRNGIQPPKNRHAVNRAIAGINPADATYARYGRKAWEAEFMTKAIRTKPDAVNEGWFGDHHQFDVFVLDERGRPVRPWLTAWYDIGSGMLVGWCISLNPNSSTITEALARAIAKKPGSEVYGAPKWIYIDNGNEEETEMSVIGGVLLFAAGAAIGGGAVAYHKGCVRVVEHRAAREKDALRREVYDVKFRSECDRAYRKGYSDGRADPLSDAEKLARTGRGRGHRAGRERHLCRREVIPMAKRERSRVKSSIDQLPARTKAELEAMLSDTGNGLTYRDMADEVEAQCGIRLSTSAIQRYAARYNRDARQLAVMTERMRMVAKYMEDHSPADLSAYVAALIQDGLMRRVQDGAEEIDDIPIESALKLAIQANRVSTYTYRYRDQTLERVDMSDAERDEDRMNWLRGLLRNRPELLTPIEEAIRDDESGGNAEMVCDSGDDGHGGGVLPAPERAGH